jgi:hypothetical protein
MTGIQAWFFGGREGELFLESRAIVFSEPRPDYYAMQEDGPALEVINGQMGIDVWVDDDQQPIQRRWFPLPRTFDEAFNRLLQLNDGWEESDWAELREEYRLECLKGMMRGVMNILAYIH